MSVLGNQEREVPKLEVERVRLSQKLHVKFVVNSSM